MKAAVDVITVYPPNKPVWVISNMGSSVPCLSPTEAFAPTPGLLEVRVKSASRLHSTQHFGSMNPYVTAKVGKQRKSTLVRKKGGTDPEWNETLCFEIEGDEDVIKFKVRSKNRLGRDDVVGSASLSLQRAIWLHCNSLNVHNPEAKSDSDVQKVLDVLRFTDISDAKKKQIQAILAPSRAAQQVSSYAWCELGRDTNLQLPAGNLLVSFAHFGYGTPEFAAYRADVEAARSKFWGSDRKKEKPKPIIHLPQLSREKSGEIKVAKDPIFGGSLANAVAHSKSVIPVVVFCCVRYLIHSGLDTVGLLRVPGNNTQIQELRETFENKGNVEFRDPLDVGGLLKLYLRLLDPPLIPCRSFDSYLAVLEEGNMQAKCTRLKKLIETLGQQEQDLLSYVIHFLTLVASKSDVNKMTVSNCAIVMSPNLLRRELADAPNEPQAAAKEMQKATEVVGLMIEKFSFLWKNGPPRPFELQHPTVERPVIMHFRRLATLRSGFTLAKQSAAREVARSISQMNTEDKSRRRSSVDGWEKKR